MQDWLRVTLLLCAFGTLREIRPSEPYVTEFLSGEWRNVTAEQVYRDVYPIGTYSYLSLLVIVFLLTDLLRFKPIILVSGISGILVYTILIWTVSIEWLKVSQFVYGVYMATEVAYLTYIYAKVEADKYPRVSSYTRMAALVGRFISGSSAQILVYFRLMDLMQLNYITFTAQVLATCWVAWLPRVPYSVYFHRRRAPLPATHSQAKLHAEPGTPTADKSQASWYEAGREALSLIGRHAGGAYRRREVALWSALYAAALCLYVQAQYYVQLLWMDTKCGGCLADAGAGAAPTADETALNGLVEAVLTLCGAGGAYVASRGAGASCLAPAPAAALQGLALYLAAALPSVYVAYAGYVVAGVLYHYVITVASAKIASELSDDSCFGLIFGINTLAGTALQSLLTYLVITALGLSVRHQFYVISGLYAALAAFWLVCWYLLSARNKKSLAVN